MSTNPNFTVDLHAHTTRSDGNDSPAGLLEHAAARGLKAVAITDHDVLPPDEVVATVVQGRSLIEFPPQPVAAAPTRNAAAVRAARTPRRETVGRMRSLSFVEWSRPSRVPSARPTEARRTLARVSADASTTPPAERGVRRATVS